jgi:hypothetical protein
MRFFEKISHSTEWDPNSKKINLADACIVAVSGACAYASEQGHIR